MSADHRTVDVSGQGDRKRQPGDRRRTLGCLGEQLAVEHLIHRGFQILERNFRTRWGELDIVALDGRTLVFCEVKTRRGGSTGITPFDSLHTRKRAQVRKIARRWLSDRTQRPAASALRFDAIGVTIDRSGQLIALEHLEGAF